MKKKSKVRVTCIECPNCKDIIYSRAHYDFRSCTCGDTAIDGGFDYTRIVAKVIPKSFIKYVMGETRQTLYNDWNKQVNKFGVIHNKDRQLIDIRKKLIVRIDKKEYVLWDFKVDNGLTDTLMKSKDVKLFGKYISLYEEIVYNFSFKKDQ